ncbi:hypothetical protein L1049_013869 [Liquidambar formosana]|uniref:Uncharacterized protein n=1 Tax=Liquidambar formosana TaxID=63359 RepID=A0AAP0RL72_LIQFO
MLGERQQVSYSREGNKADDKNRTHSNHIKDGDMHHKSEAVPKSIEKVDQNNRSGSFDSDSEDTDKYRADVKEKRKHKRSDRHEMASDDDDSQIEERKEVKRRKKEEKRMRKEERRRRREERRRRREERRAEKLKVRSMDTATPPSDFEKNQNDAYASDGELVARKESQLSDTEETESEQKRLEIELRKKALESLRAKKGISH